MRWGGRWFAGRFENTEVAGSTHTPDHTRPHRCNRLNQKCVVVVSSSRRRPPGGVSEWPRGGRAAAAAAAAGGGGGGGGAESSAASAATASASSCLEAAIKGTLAALVEGVHLQRPEECAAAMVLALHRLLADGRCDRRRAVMTL
jgi:hypothetical protein